MQGRIFIFFFRVLYLIGFISFYVRFSILSLSSFMKLSDLIPNFGCSDCDCESHLFKIKNLDNILNFGVKEL